MGEEQGVTAEPEVDIDPFTQRPRQPRQGELDSNVTYAVENLFDNLLSDFVYGRRNPRPTDPKPVSPKVVSEMLRPYDLDDWFKEWWFGDSEDPERNEDGERWDDED